MKEIFIILYNIRSAHNVGSMFRTADAAGVSKVYLAGHTPTPVDRFGRARRDIAKVALGAEKTVPWEHAEDTDALIAQFQKENVAVVAVEQHEQARDYRTFRPQKSTAFVFGNEVEGIPPDVLALCDTVIEVPMNGGKESLNVSVAAGVILFQCRFQGDTFV